MNLQALSEDFKFQNLMEAGWTWTVVEKQWPDLPKLAERAWSARNAAVSGTNELELRARPSALCPLPCPACRKIPTRTYALFHGKPYNNPMCPNSISPQKTVYIYIYIYMFFFGGGPKVYSLYTI